MALELSVELDNGVEVTYHTIIQTNANWLGEGEVVVDIASYTSETQRRKNEYKPIHSQRFSFNGRDFKEGEFPFAKGQDLVVPAYTLLKADANFEGSKDV